MERHGARFADMRGFTVVAEASVGGAYPGDLHE
jgi:hypothetical protein